VDLHREIAISTDRSDGRESLEWLFGLIHRDQPWRKQGACVRVSPTSAFLTDVFFCEGHENEKRRVARAVCGGCPVKQECLDYALRHHEKFGIWGGLTERERRRYRRHAA
jgi:WhiB family redox-sensing transcriptional regulator